MKEPLKYYRCMEIEASADLCSLVSSRMNLNVVNKMIQGNSLGDYKSKRTSIKLCTQNVRFTDVLLEGKIQRKRKRVSRQDSKIALIPDLSVLNYATLPLALRLGTSSNDFKYWMPSSLST